MNKPGFNDHRSAKNNFNLLRLVAAYFVLISHSYGLLQKPFSQPLLSYAGKTIIVSDVGLDIFFTISGFLVTQSLFNSNSLKHYLWKRTLRIFPALIVANISCIILGCFITTYRFKDFLFNKETLLYFIKNSTLVINQFYLPGVFANLKDRSVNASLWSIWPEVECYLVLCMGAYHIVCRKWLYLTCFILFQALRVYLVVFNNFHFKGLDLPVIFTFGTYFYLGSLLYVFKNDIQFKWIYANVLMAVALVTVYTFLEPITISLFFAYCFIIIATSKQLISLKGYDVSYGVYLYAFPIQQALIFYLGYSVDVWLHVALSALFATLIAFLSWRFVEKPFLKKKAFIS